MAFCVVFFIFVCGSGSGFARTIRFCFCLTCFLFEAGLFALCRENLVVAAWAFGFIVWVRGVARVFRFKLSAPSLGYALT